MSDLRELNDRVDATIAETIEQLVSDGLNDEPSAARAMAYKAICMIDNVTCEDCKKGILSGLKRYLDALLAELDGVEGHHRVH
jgi:hypothetical protein